MIDTLKFYCQKVLPAVYDESLSYYEVVCKVASKLNEVISSQNNLIDQWNQFSKEFNTNLMATVIAIFEEWKKDGTLEGIIDKVCINKVDRQEAVFTALRSDKTSVALLVQNPSGTNLLIDTSYAANVNNMTCQLQAMGITKIDYIMISHYDYDHAGGLYALSTASDIINMEGATIFLPETPDFTKFPTSNMEYYNQVQEVITNLHMTAIQPKEGDTYAVGTKNETLRFTNCEHNRYYNSPNYKYNDCSLCCYYELFKNRFFYSSDIEYEAQLWLSTRILESDIASIPHHALDMFYVRDLAVNLNAKTFVAFNGTGDAGRGRLYLTSNSIWQYYAQEHSIPVYPTSNNNGNLIFHFTEYCIDMITYPFETSEGLKTYNSMWEIINYKSTSTKTITLEEVIQNMEFNSIANFTVTSDFAVYQQFAQYYGTDAIMMTIKKSTSVGYTNSLMTGRTTLYFKAIVETVKCVNNIIKQPVVRTITYNTDNANPWSVNDSILQESVWCKVASNASLTGFSGVTQNVPNFVLNEDGTLQVKFSGYYKLSLSCVLSSGSTTDWMYVTIKEGTTTRLTCGTQIIMNESARHAGTGSNEIFTYLSSANKISITVDGDKNALNTITMDLQLLNRDVNYQAPSMGVTPEPTPTV